MGSDKLNELKKMCDGQNYRTFCTSGIRQFAKENNFLIFHGASDDLLEVNGVFDEEFDIGGSTDFANYTETRNVIQEKLLQFMKKVNMEANFCPRTGTTWEVLVDTGIENAYFFLKDYDQKNIGLIISYTENI